MKFLYKEDLEMAIEKQYLSDVAAILSHRHDNGADLWATPDNKLLKGSPFSTFDSVLYLLELGMSPQEPVLKAAADLIFSAWQEDGRFRIYPTGGIYPCQTAIAANVLCHMGYAEDERLQKTFQHFLDIQYKDGGWRCNKFSFGHGEETEYSNPQPTLNALDAFRFSQYLNNEPALDRAVEFFAGALGYSQANRPMPLWNWYAIYAGRIPIQKLQFVSICICLVFLWLCQK